MKNVKGVDCRHFLGEKPCLFHNKCREKDCPDYKEYGYRILIIKFSAVGDVLRTTPILPALKAKYKDAHITWLTTARSKEILDGNPDIDRVMVFDTDTGFCLLNEHFNCVISLDKDPLAISMANLAHSKRKLGFGMTENGSLGYYNKSSEYAFKLGFDDDLKFRKNRKTYQAIIFDMCELPAKYGRYILKTERQDLIYAKNLLKKWKIKSNDRVIGLNIGAGSVFLTKKWPEDLFLKLAERIYKKLKARILLLGGPAEADTNRRMASKASVPIINTGNDHTIKRFTEMIGQCDLIVTVDTLAMHLAIAKRVPVVALFGPTTPHEVDLYSRGIKISADTGCAPCYKYKCDDMTCMDSITPEKVLAACLALLK